MSDDINILKQPDKVRVSFYGALFAIASADGVIDKDEAESIYESLVLDGLSQQSRQAIHESREQSINEHCDNRWCSTPSQSRRQGA